MFATLANTMNKTNRKDHKVCCYISTYVCILISVPVLVIYVWQNQLVTNT